MGEELLTKHRVTIYCQESGFGWSARKWRENHFDTEWLRRGQWVSKVSDMEPPDYWLSFTAAKNAAILSLTPFNDDPETNHPQVYDDPETNHPYLVDDPEAPRR